MPMDIVHDDYEQCIRYQRNSRIAGAICMNDIVTCCWVMASIAKVRHHNKSTHKNLD